MKTYVRLRAAIVATCKILKRTSAYWQHANRNLFQNFHLSSTFQQNFALEKRRLKTPYGQTFTLQTIEGTLLFEKRATDLIPRPSLAIRGLARMCSTLGFAAQSNNSLLWNVRNRLTGVTNSASKFLVAGFRSTSKALP